MFNRIKNSLNNFFLRLFNARKGGEFNSLYTLYQFTKTKIWKIKSNKNNGISVCVRLHEDKYVNTLHYQLKYISSSVGEIIIHYNGLNNEKYFINKFSNIENCTLKKYSADNLNFTKYTNDFIDEMQYKWFFLFDSDMIFNLKKLINFIKKVNNSSLNIFYNLSGINILMDRSKKLGFSNSDPKCEFLSFVGAGDFVCYVPYYTRNKKLYRYADKEKSLNGINLRFYKIEFIGLLFLHLSLLKFSSNFVDEKIDFEIIKNNIYSNDLATEYVKDCYINIMQKTNLNDLNDLLELYRKMSSFFLNLYKKN